MKECARTVTSVPSKEMVSFENVELELGLATSEDDYETKYKCPVFLHKDESKPGRYFATHSAGVHSVTISCVDELQSYVTGPEGKKFKFLRKILFTGHFSTEKLEPTAFRFVLNFKLCFSCVKIKIFRPLCFFAQNTIYFFRCGSHFWYFPTAQCGGIPNLHENHLLTKRKSHRGVFCVSWTNLDNRFTERRGFGHFGNLVRYDSAQDRRYQLGR